MTWETVPLGTLATLNPRGQNNQITATFLGMADLAEDGKTSQGVQLKPEDLKPGYTPFRNKDLLVAKITPCFENGKIGQASIPTDQGWGSTEFHVVRPDDARINRRYLLHFLRSPVVRASGQIRMTGSGGQRRVPADFLRQLSVPLPPLAEQRRIAAILDEADAIVRNSQMMLDSATSVITSGLGDSILLTPDVEMRPLSDFIDPARPLTYGILKPGPDIDGGIPYIRVADMDGVGIRLAGVRRTTPEISKQYRRSQLKRGDLLMSIRGHVGRLALIPEEIDGANITQDSARIAADGVRPEFLAVWIRSQQSQRWMARHTKGVAVRGINLGDLRNLPTPVVSEAEQNRIAAVAREFAEARLTAARRLDRARALFASLQHRAFRGEL
ncbi:hypothetical protein F6J84_09800 [Microbacterium caowuchunii]|uniref:restriction endonuclease subunit S n=1 Tax=Microbacterium caowuchunii TaxID=2614638 RepID=UPI0012466928|nr:restriction endonuclease subunit S [Microbacterium caowuchunii]QEW00356.1 hypothetical protein F6J84_09800 [Microbacterium caowuchunii]